MRWLALLLLAGTLQAQSMTLAGGGVLQPWLGRPKCGDCNLDMQLNILDALQAAKIGAGMVIRVPPHAAQACDVHNPSPAHEVDILDALVLARFSAGQIPLIVCP